MRVIGITFILFFIINSCGVFSGGKNKFSAQIGFYNVENLFDTINDPKINDEEFTPGSEKKYNTAKYREKLTNLSKVIKAFPSGPPAILGLCEVENRLVIEDLVKTLGSDYKIVHSESPDNRGIDVALLYSPAIFQPLSERQIVINFEFSKFIKTRNILYVKGLMAGEEMHFFVNHWPSRSGGQAISVPKRMVAGLTLRKAVDSVLNTDSEAKIAIMGDFNDEPFNGSLIEALRADTVLTGASELYNTSYYMIKNKIGSYNYKGDWNVLDQMIVSKNMINAKKGLRLSPPFQTGLVNEEFMLYTNNQDIKVPSRSFGGNRYYGGYSDHLPIYITIVK